MTSKTFSLNYPWDVNGYKPHVEFRLSVDDKGFLMNIKVSERNPKRIKTEHQSDVHKDSCVEWFANFAPEICDCYFNFEVNANGAMHVAFRKNRYEKRELSIEDIAMLNIQTEISEEMWTVDYCVPFSLIKKYIPQYHYVKGMSIRTNFYKCGDETEFPHYGIWKEYPLEKPDFHRPEYFGEILLD